MTAHGAHVVVISVWESQRPDVAQHTEMLPLYMLRQVPSITPQRRSQRVKVSLFLTFHNWCYSAISVPGAVIASLYSLNTFEAVKVLRAT